MMELELPSYGGRILQFKANPNINNAVSLMGINSLFIGWNEFATQISLEDSRKLLKWLIEREIRIAKNEPK